MRLQTKLILLIWTLLLLIIGTFAVTIQNMHAESEKKQIGTRAMTIAQTVAQIPEIRHAFGQASPSAIIQPIAESIRIQSGAEFIVVGNREGIRYSHPLPDQIGKSMRSAGDPLLKSLPAITEDTGSLGPSLRARVPVYADDKQIIGVVSVGFLLHDIEKMNQLDRNRVLWLSAGSLLVGLLGALLIARSVKRAIFGLEPHQIGRLYREKQAVLESIREGILAINQQGHITMINQTAFKLLHLAEGQAPIGAHIRDVLPTSRLLDVVQSGQAEYDIELIAGTDILLVNRVPVLNHQGQVIGAVSSFRNKSELSKVTAELSQVKRYADALRAQTHEYSNKLYTISGLIQLESYREAIELITRESDVHRNLAQFIMKEVPDPIVGGLLIGKFNRANELKVDLSINPDSSFTDLPQGIDRSELVTILGNLIDNAMEAVLGADVTEKRVTVFLTDLGNDLILEVEDTGPGIRTADAEQLFQIGYSTKPGKEHRGYGLALVQQAVHQLGGYITCESNQPHGSIFTVAIPKELPAIRTRSE